MCLKDTKQKSTFNFERSLKKMVVYFQIKMKVAITT